MLQLLSSDIIPNERCDESKDGGTPCQGLELVASDSCQADITAMIIDNVGCNHSDAGSRAGRNAEEQESKLYQEISKGSPWKRWIE